ncbi:MAG: hypothetical protein JWQ71_3989 [Pedosphaera sp.]|nr:hypothetical protein [Pedosphaera sp.]
MPFPQPMFIIGPILGWENRVVQISDPELWIPFLARRDADVVRNDDLMTENKIGRAEKEQPGQNQMDACPCFHTSNIPLNSCNSLFIFRHEFQIDIRWQLGRRKPADFFQGRDGRLNIAGSPR